MAELRDKVLGKATCWMLLAALAMLGAGCPPPAGEPVEIEIPATADTTLYESITGVLANGAGEHLFTGRTDQGKRRRALLRFDVAGVIPEDATIRSAELRMQVTRTPPAAAPVIHRVFVAGSNWGEGDSDAPFEEGAGTASEIGDATWIHTFFQTESWPAPGGGEFPLEEARATLSVDEVGTYAFTSTELAEDVQDWLDGALEDFGWIVLGDEKAITIAKQWRSRESDVEDERPVLVVKYQP